MTKPISAYNNVKELQVLMRNAKALGREDVYSEAFSRRCELEGVDYSDPLEREFYAALAAYEEILKEKNGRTTRASYTRRALKAKGVIGCLEDWALSPAETEGFRALVSRGLVKLTGEFLVSKYPEHFSQAAVENARRRLASQPTLDG